MAASMKTILLVAMATSALNGAPRSRYASGYMYSYYVPQSASTPWRPAWSPDGKEIAFSMAGSLWKIQVGDTTAYELTRNPTYDSSPAWSPDRKWIAYSTEDGAGVNLMLFNVATGESTAVTKGSALNLDPVWAPDGKRLAFARNEPRGQFHVFTMDFAGGRFSEPQRLTVENSFGRQRLYFGVYDDHISPTWSPDGKEMILVSNRGIPLGSGAIWRAPVAGDLMSKARMLLREETLYRTQPQWSKDGKRILYSSHRGSQYNNLYVLPVGGGEPYQFTFGDWDHFDPRWSPDGEWIVYVSNQHGLSDLRLLRSFGGEERRVEIKRRVHREPMGKLEVLLSDGGRPTAARMYVTGPNGKAYAPPTSYARVEGRSKHRDFFHAEGSFTVDLPPGEVQIEAAKGVEYAPVSRTVKIEPGVSTTIRLDFERIINMNALGWYSASDHVHMNYGGNLHNTPRNLLMMARAEDLDVIGEKVANKDNRIFDHHHYTPAPHRLSSSDHILTFGEEYRPPFYGHINFINLTRHLISPFTTGYEGTAIESLYPSNTDMFRLGRAQGALSGYVHPWSQEPEKSTYAVARGFPVDLALGTFDYLEVLTSASHFTNTEKTWHRALNCGFKVTASAGEDSILNLHATPILGSARLYAYLGDKLDWSAYVEAIRRGRTFVTNGPLLTFQVNGEIAGSEIHLPAGGGTVEFTAAMKSIAHVDKLEVIMNGKAVESLPLAGATKRLRIDKSGWLTLRGRSAKAENPIDDSYLVAETGPVYVYVGGQPIRSAEDARYFIGWIDDVKSQAAGHPGWRSEREKSHVLAQFDEARKVFESR
jgi:Tol biopolymer transport system component